MVKKVELINIAINARFNNTDRVLNNFGESLNESRPDEHDSFQITNDETYKNSWLYLIHMLYSDQDGKKFY
jgi:hypothetical protein